MEKELLEYLGIDSEKVKTLEDFKAAFDPAFIRKSVDVIKKDEIFEKLVGNITGSITTKSKSLFKELGVEFEPDEIKGKPVEEIISVGIGKLKANFQTKITDLEGKVGLTNDEAFKAIEKERDKLKSQAEDYKSKFAGLGTEFETFKTNVITEGKNKTLKEFKEKAFSDVKFNIGATKYEKIGFISDIEKNCILDLDETGTKLVIMDKEGKGIPNTKIAGKLFEPSEYLQQKAIDEGLFSVNPHGGRAASPAPTERIINHIAPENSRPVNPRAIPV